MVWQPILTESAATEKLPALNILSPSWFSIVSADGMIANKADYQYSVMAKESKYKLWPLITNSFDPDLTHKFLNDKNARKNIIKQHIGAIYAIEADIRDKKLTGEEARLPPDARQTAGRNVLPVGGPPV